MHVDAGHANARQLCGAGIDRTGARRAARRTCSPTCRSRFSHASRNRRPGLTRTEIRAVRPVSPANRDSNSSSGSDSTLMQRISAASAARSSASVLPTPENKILLRRNAGGQRALQLAARNHVRAGAEFCQRAQHRLVGVGLHGVTDQRLLVGKGFAEHPVMALQRRGRIAIERRADRFSQLDQIHRLGVKHAVAIVEVIHGGLAQLLFSSGSRRNGFLGPLPASAAHRRHSSD